MREGYPTASDGPAGCAGGVTPNLRRRRPSTVPDCRRIIVPVPEIETTGQKLKKKLDQIRSDIEKTRENWQEQKAEQKEDKKWNKRKGKDPWEW